MDVDVDPKCRFQQMYYQSKIILYHINVYQSKILKAKMIIEFYLYGWIFKKSSIK